MNIYLFEQVVYIPPNTLKMEIRKTKFVSFWGRSLQMCIYLYSRFLGIFTELNQENNHRSLVNF